MQKQLFIYSFVFLFWSSSCFPVIVADIDLVDFQHTVPRKNISLENGAQDPYSQALLDQSLNLVRHLRIAFFNTNTQEFVDVLGAAGQQTPLKIERAIYYLSLFQIGIEPFSVSLSFPSWFNITCLYQGQQAGLNLDILPVANILRDSRVIRYNGNILSTPTDVLLDRGLLDETRPYLRLTSHIQVQGDPFPSRKDVQQICSFFNAFEGKEKDRNKSLEGYFYFGEIQNPGTPAVLKRNKTSFQQKAENQALKNEKGKIGELAADITMQWLGFSKKDGKYGDGKDNGFDGVYSRDDMLFISDSKFFATTPNLENVLNKDIYAMINKRLANIEYEGTQKQKETAAYMREFMVRYPYSVYLLPYIVIADGKVKAMARGLREVHADLDPTKYTALLEMLFNNLTITPQQNPGPQLPAAIQNQAQANLQMSPLEAFQYIQFFMQKFGMHGEYRLVKHEDAWQAVTTESVRNPLLRLGKDDNERLRELLSHIPQKVDKREVVRAVGEIADPAHQAQVMANLYTILENENNSAKHQLPWVIRNLSSSLKPTNYEKAKKLAAYVFDLGYEPKEESYLIPYDFSLENRMAIFEAFLKSPHSADEESWDDFLFLYYVIHGSLCSIGAEAENTILYLSDYVEELEEWPTGDLLDLTNLIDKIYDTKCYSNLKDGEDCENWMLLMQALQSLTPKERIVVSEFIDWLPSSFNFGPADAIEQVLVPLLPSIDQLESFEVLEPIFIRAFKLYDEQEDQIVCIEEIIQGVKEKKSEQKIMKKIEKLLS